MHFFDLQYTLFAKHAQHIVLVHFPIALVCVALLFDLLELRRRDGNWARAAYYNLSIAAAATVPVIVTGLLAWRWQLEGTPIRGVLRLHLVLGLSSAVLIVIAWWNARRSSSRVQRIAIEAMAVLTVAATAHLGGVVAGLVS
jgi:uncharacterized membrane protein